MKRAILLLTLLTWISGCFPEPKTAQKVAVHVIADTTDPHLLCPLADDILALYRLDKDMNKAVSFRLTTISDKMLNPAIEYHLADGFLTEKDNVQEDEQYRQKLVLGFYVKVRNVLSDFKRKSAELHPSQYSECYRVIAHELNLLAKKKATERTLLIYSDGQEKSNIFDCYNPSNQALLQSDIGAVEARLIKAYPLRNDLHNITVRFVYKACSRIEDQRYMAIIKVYDSLLTRRGAKVTIQADNSFLTYE
ncbi:MAG: hypothetical protein K8F30_07470 [Taibaiella sp.]|nr:hypothetical protein [Taibaiella sp.]